MNELNIIPIWFVTVLFCLSSYVYGRLVEFYDSKLVGALGLIWNIILGFVFALLAVKSPVFR